MRIVTGKYKGFNLDSPLDSSVRPTSDKIREAIASSVSSFFGLDLSCINVLDAFAGTGALGLELLSRGAAHATFIDKNKKSLQVLKNNISHLKIEPADYTVYHGDAVQVCSTIGKHFDCVFLDPPYKLDPSLSAQVISVLLEVGNIDSNTLIVHERDSFADVLCVDGFEIFKTSKYGTTSVEYLKSR